MAGSFRRYSLEVLERSALESTHIISRVERKTIVTQNMFLKPLFRGNLDPFVNNANLGAIAHTSSGT